MTSVLNVDTIADKAGTGPVALTKQIAAKLFVTLEADNATVSNSQGMSSVTDNGTGDFSHSFTNSFDAAQQYVFSGIAAISSGGTQVEFCKPRTDADLAVGSVRVFVGSLSASSGSQTDHPYAAFICTGDLA